VIVVKSELIRAFEVVETSQRIRETDVVQSSEKFFIEIRQTGVVIHPYGNSEGIQCVSGYN
jgi:hypothetical protein